MRIAVPLGQTIHPGFRKLRTSGGIFDKNVEKLGQNFQENFRFLNYETPSLTNKLVDSAAISFFLNQSEFS